MAGIPLALAIWVRLKPPPPLSPPLHIGSAPTARWQVPLQYKGWAVRVHAGPPGTGGTLHFVPATSLKPDAWHGYLCHHPLRTLHTHRHNTWIPHWSPLQALNIQASLLKPQIRPATPTISCWRRSGQSV